MRISYLIPAAISATAILTACGTTTRTNAQLEEARANYAVVQSDPRAPSLASVEFQQASEALSAANRALEQGEDDTTVNHLAYLAKQRVAIAQSTMSRRAAELLVENAAKEREQIRLSQRTREAEQAKLSAQTAQSQAESARMQAQIARDQALEAERQRAQADSQLQASQQRTSQLETQLQGLQAKKTSRGTVITLGDVLFSTGSADLKPGGMRNLQKLAEMMRTNPDMDVSVEGFTDSTGRPDRNRLLSQQRADAVKDALVGMGIEADRIATQGFGPQYPVASNDTMTGRQLNRRVEVLISGTSGETSSGQ
jgi:outer membrane protein OmpA-like peptidoglycan-associated protein